jgi:hypothetical protein
VVHAKARADHSEAEWLEARQQLEDAERRASRRKGDLGAADDVFRCLLPRLYLEADSLELLDQFERKEQMLGLLRKLDRDESVPRIRMQGYKNVFEVDRHVSTGGSGSADMGRVYVRLMSDKRLWVRVHRKLDEKEQGRFVKRFAERPEPV